MSDRGDSAGESHATAQDRPPGPQVIPSSLLNPSLSFVALASAVVLANTAFVLLWASVFDFAGVVGLVWLVLFTGSVGLGLAYALREGALTWR